MLLDDAKRIGKIGKLRAARGDVQVILDGITADMLQAEFLLIEIEGLKVPFRIKSLDCRGTTLYASFEENLGDAATLAGQSVYCQKGDLAEPTADDIGASISLLRGFTVVDGEMGRIGKIASLDTSTANTIISVDHDGSELLIPLAEELVTGIDIKNKTISMTLPEGLIAVAGSESAERQPQDE